MSHKLVILFGGDDPVFANLVNSVDPKNILTIILGDIDSISSRTQNLLRCPRDDFHSITTSIVEFDPKFVVYLLNTTLKGFDSELTEIIKEFIVHLNESVQMLNSFFILVLLGEHRPTSLEEIVDYIISFSRGAVVNSKALEAHDNQGKDWFEKLKEMIFGLQNSEEKILSLNDTYD